MTLSPTTFACDMTAIAPADRQRHIRIIDSLFQSVLKIDGLADGYGFALPQEDAQLNLAVTFIARERLYCPFFDFALRVEDTGRRWRLDITGPPGVKPFIITEFCEHVRKSVPFPAHET